MTQRREPWRFLTKNRQGRSKGRSSPEIIVSERICENLQETSGNHVFLPSDRGVSCGLFHPKPSLADTYWCLKTRWLKFDQHTHEFPRFCNYSSWTPFQKMFICHWVSCHPFIATNSPTFPSRFPTGDLRQHGNRRIHSLVKKCRWRPNGHPHNLNGHVHGKSAIFGHAPLSYCW